MNNILVTGANGQVGSEVKKLVDSGAFSFEDTRFFFTTKEELDIADFEQVKAFIEKNDINTIVNCAAYTLVDHAEKDKEQAYAVNHRGVENLAQIAKEKDIWLLHISTDYVFSGEHHSPINENEKTSPQGVYAHSKLAGEESIKKLSPKHALIIRTSWVYSTEGSNFVKTMRRLGAQKEKISVVCDQIGTPTYAKDIASLLLTIIKKGKESTPSEPTIYHYSSEGNCSWYDFAQAIFEFSGITCKVDPIPTEAYPTPAKRPAYSVLDKSKIKKHFGIEIPYWRDSLKECINKIDQKEGKVYSIGVIGSGFIASGLTKLLLQHPNYKVSGVLTRSDLSKRNDFCAPELLTNDIAMLIATSDLIVECSGDAIYATENIEKVLEAKLPVVTMNSEFHITTGSYFVDKGLVTEAEGDQPGVLAILHEEALSMGFKPVLYANIKGFLNENPPREEMEYWGGKSNLSLEMVTSFTDGTKVQIEQVLVANGLGANLIQEGLVKLPSDDMLEGGTKLVEMAKEKGIELPVSDYVLSPKLPAGVFLLVEHQEDQKPAIKYYKLGDGPYYVLERTYHLCHLEIVKTIHRVLHGGGVLLDNSAKPKYSVAAITKKDLKVGEVIEKGIGSFEVRGSSVEIAKHPNLVPIGLLVGAKLKCDKKEGEYISFDDVELPQSRALEIWQNDILRKG
ncbi:MAG: dTDP-4-dehydrorhamnose reductase [Epsilonproteobacteria bacterium]|nr:dTDP-4-dehydrorhamnose reductase [Campylobacterota bacterium]